MAAAGASAADPATLFIVEGAGWGHGVGMGQFGAEGYALHGWSYTRILEHYYPHTTLAHGESATVRVLLEEQAKQVLLRSRAPFLLIDARDQKVDMPARTLRLTSKLRVSGRSLVPPLRVQAGAAVLSVGGTGYRGNLTVLRSGGGLDVVNTLPLERYLRGVVPAEMPKHWSAAAYEAQAVAARSYALSGLRPGAEFDLYPDTRDQVYGGVAAERPETNQAVGETHGQILTYDSQPIRAYYSASTGGQTDDVRNAFPGREAVPYLVSVADPYDSISPLHRWHISLDLAQVESAFGVAVRDVRVRHDAAGYATSVELIGAHQTVIISGLQFSRVLGLRSHRFSIDALSLDQLPHSAAFGEMIPVQGFIRGANDVSLQRLMPNGAWRTVSAIHSHTNGRFTLALRALASTSYRLAVQQFDGQPTTIEVVPRLTMKTEGNVVSGTIKPPLPLQVERRTHSSWRPFRTIAVGPSGFFRIKLPPGVYRANSGAVTDASRSLASTTSAPLAVYG